MDSQEQFLQPTDNEATIRIKRRQGLLFKVRRLLVVAVLCMAVALWFFNSNNGYDSTVLIVEKGSTAASVAAMAKEAGVVRSETLFYAALVMAGDPSNIKAGSYVLETGLSTFDIATMIYQNTPQDPLVSVTLPEGITAKEMAVIFSAKLPLFDTETFLQLVGTKEGYLWPETYFVTEDFTAKDAYELLYKTADTERERIFQDSKTAFSKEEVIILASIVEREANTPESMRMVAGILRNRLEIAMPLQADATIEYILEDKIGQLPPGQLAEYLETLDSPYNSYLYSGLPPTPIGNPGEDAIRAVLSPAETSDLYYITDDEGVFHYAATYDQHLENVARYLR